MISISGTPKDIGEIVAQHAGEAIKTAIYIELMKHAKQAVEQAAKEIAESLLIQGFYNKDMLNNVEEVHIHINDVKNKFVKTQTVVEQKSILS